jgi:formate dehydrogenase maturation protein FdhE
LGYFHVEGEENRYQAATCEQCRGYMKMVTTLAPLTEIELLVTDLATLHLDLAARHRGLAS